MSCECNFQPTSSLATPAFRMYFVVSYYDDDYEDPGTLFFPVLALRCGDHNAYSGEWESSRIRLVIMDDGKMLDTEDIVDDFKDLLQECEVVVCRWPEEEDEKQLGLVKAKLEKSLLSRAKQGSKS